MKYAYKTVDGDYKECTSEEYQTLLRLNFVVTTITEEPTLKSELIDVISEGDSEAAAIIDELISDEDFDKLTELREQEIEYLIDEEVINPDYEDGFDSDTEVDIQFDTLSAPVASSSSDPNNWYPRAVIVTPPKKEKVGYDDIKRIQGAIYQLVEGGMANDSDELDGSKFAKRLETYRDVSVHTKKKDRQTPSILFLPDFSPSCSSYNTLYSTLLNAVSAIRDDFNVIVAPTYNGVPKWYVVNGVRSSETLTMHGNDYVKDFDRDGDLDASVIDCPLSRPFYVKQINGLCDKYGVSTIIVSGDCDGQQLYLGLLNTNPNIDRFVWLDGSYLNKSQTTMLDSTDELLKAASLRVSDYKSRLTYFSGVKDTKLFVRALERCNNW